MCLFVIKYFYCTYNPGKSVEFNDSPLPFMESVWTQHRYNVLCCTDVLQKRIRYKTNRLTNFAGSPVWRDKFINMASWLPVKRNIMYYFSWCACWLPRQKNENKNRFFVFLLCFRTNENRNFTSFSCFHETKGVISSAGYKLVVWTVVF